jgi:hypothetical protein
MWQNPTIFARRPRVLLHTALVISCIALSACGANQAEEAATATPFATVAPNARTLPDETTVVEAAPLAATTEAEATAMIESAEVEATDMAQNLDEEATEMARDQEQAATGATPAATPTSAETGVAELRAYMGKSVVVRGNITELIGQHAFLIEDQALLDGAEALVIYDRADFALAAGQGVMVGGEVRAFDLGSLEETTGLDLPDQQLTALQTDPVLVADSMTRIP